MSTPESRKGRRKLGLFAAVAAAFGLFLALGVSNAAASVACTYDDTAGQVYIVVSDGNTAPPTDNVINVSRNGAGGILVNGAFCVSANGNSATTANTDQINVLPSATFGADGDDSLVINNATGGFLPGFTQNEGNLNEIEWFVNLGGFNVNGNNLYVIGNSGSEGVTAGQDGGGTNWDGVAPGSVGTPPATALLPEPVAPEVGDFLVNLNAGNLTDADADIWVANGNTGCVFPGGIASRESCTLEFATFNLDGGNNTFIGKGGDGTGEAVCGTDVQTTDDPLAFGDFGVQMMIVTTTGDDTVIGGECSDIILVGGGTNYVEGNGPFFSAVSAFQDDLAGEWALGFFNFGIVPTFGDIVSFAGQPGPATITINPDGSLTTTGIPGGTVTGVEHVIGTNGNDTINGNAQENFLSGAGGDDTVNGNDGDDFVAGDAIITVDETTGLPVWSDAADAGNDTLAGDLGDDAVVGGPGNDTLDENAPLNADGSPAYGPFGNGADALDGSSGVDTVTYSARTNRIVVYLGLISTFNDGADTNADGLTNEYDDVFFTTENVITGSGDDLVSANFVNNRANNVFTDNGGNDCLEGGPGNDTFEQGSAPQGADVMIGNTGADTANYADRSGAVAVSLDGVANDGDIATNEGDNVGGFSVSCRPQTVVVNPPIGVIVDIFGDATILNDLNFLDAPVAGPAPNCFGIIPLAARTAQGFGFTCDSGETLGGDQAPLVNVDVENVNGGSGDDELTGNGVGNVLNGNGGNDTINGGASTDQLNGGAGDDTIAGGAGNDAIDGGEGTNRVDYSSAGAGGVGVQVNLTTGVATGEGNDTLKNIQNVNGSSFADAISGNDQDNILNGGGGNDAINGNAGNDTVNGGAGADQLKGASGDDKITGGEGNDSAQGGPGNDNIQGGNGKDTLLGQKGNDKLYGNAQPDFLNGGPGSDVCKPGSPGLARGDVVVNCES